MDKKVIITGGTKGLGRALSLLFAQEGFYVYSVFGSDFGAAEDLEGEFQSLALRGRTLHWNLSQPMPSQLQVSPCDELVLINNAVSPFEPKPFHLISCEELNQTLSVTLHGSMRAVQGLIRSLVRSRSGTVINVLSTIVEANPPKGFSVYFAAKLGLLGFTQSLQCEYEGKGLRVIGVSPGFMESSLTQDWNAAMKSKQKYTPNQYAARIWRLYASGTTGHHSLDASTF